MTAAASSRRVLRRLLRWMGGVSASLALTAAFSLAAATGLVLHLDTPVGRRLAARTVTRLLAGALEGSIEIPAFDSLRPHQVTAPEVVLRDPDDAVVLTLRSVRIRLDLPAVARSILSEAERITVSIPHIRVEDADVEIIPDPETGEPTIARAVVPRAAGAPEEPAWLDRRPIRVWMPVVEVGKAAGHVRIPDVPPFHAAVARVRGQILVSPRGLAVDIRRFGAVLQGFGGTDARGTATFNLRAPGPLRGTFDGFFGDIELKGSLRLTGNHLEIAAKVPSAAPGAVDALLPGWPLREPVSASLRAQGDLPRLDVRGSVRARDTKLELEGPVWLTEPLRAELALRGRRVDLRHIWPGAPETALAVNATLDVSTEGGRLGVGVEATTEPTVIAGEAVPEVDIRGRLEEGAFEGTARVHEPGLPLDVALKVDAVGVVDLDAKASSLSLARVRHLPPGTRGNGTARFQARLDGQRLQARLSADLSRLSVAGIALGHAKVTGTARGSLDRLGDLSLDASVEGTALDAAGLSFERVTAKATGKADRARFGVSLYDGSGPSIEAAGSVVGARRLEDTVVRIRREDVFVHGRLHELDPERGLVDLRDLQLSGAGGVARGSLRLHPNLFELELEGEDIELEKVARALGLPDGAVRGRLRVNANVVTGPDVTRGRVRLALGNGSVGPVSGLSMRVAGDLSGRRFTGEASGLVEGVGSLGASWDAELAGGPLAKESWLEVLGRAHVNVGDVQLPLLGALIPEAPLRPVGGEGFAELLLERRQRRGLPNVFVRAGTRSLVAELRTEEPPLRLSDLDLHLTGGVNGETGDSTGTTLLVDGEGELVTATGAVRLDLPRFIDAPGEALRQLLETPLDANLTLHSRPIEKLPELVRPAGFGGSVGGSLHVKGTLSKPSLYASARATDLVALESRDGPPVDLSADAHYEFESGAFGGRLEAALAGRRVAQGRARGTWRAALETAGAAPWSGDAVLHLEGLPLDLARPLAEHGVSGQLFGAARLVRDDGASRVEADIRLADARVELTPLGEGSLEVRTEGKTLLTSLRLHGERGQLDARARAGLAWVAGLPALDESRPLSAELQTRELDAVVLAPLLQGVVSQLSGTIDGDVSIELNHREEKDGDGSRWAGSIHGDASLTGGRAFIDVLGLELRHLRFAAAAREQDGGTTISVRDLRARARSNEDNLAGEASLRLRGVRVESGTASMNLTNVPMLLQGVSQGRATGRATAVLRREPDHMLVEVDVPRLRARLPRSSSRSVIDLDENPDVTVLQLQTDERPGRAAVLPWKVLFRLGNDVRIRRSDVDLPVTGTPIVTLGDETVVSGAVELTPGGRIPVLGKVFVIEQGTVRFDTGNNANPRIDVTAAWRAPEGTEVYVDVRGTLNEATINLRSEPPMPEPQLFALILGGARTEPTATTATTETTGAGGEAVALGTGVAALGVNELLGGQAVELRVGTTAESRPRYTAAVRVGRNLWFEAATYQRGEVGGDAFNVVSGTIDYRFTRRWSLRTEVGNAGGAVDLLWQYRY